MVWFGESGGGDRSGEECEDGWGGIDFHFCFYFLIVNNILENICSEVTIFRQNQFVWSM